MIHGYDESECITAMCLWEWALADRQTMAWLLEGLEADHARANTLTLVELAEELYEVCLEYGYTGDFDTAFVPAFFNRVQSYSRVLDVDRYPISIIQYAKSICEVKPNV